MTHVMYGQHRQKQLRLIRATIRDRGHQFIINGPGHVCQLSTGRSKLWIEFSFPTTSRPSRGKAQLTWKNKLYWKPQSIGLKLALQELPGECLPVEVMSFRI
eukprot:TRINITY_DN41001_c0_g2_i1.p2 TRINITY_DN41001_c0_g2~~TRINITY_DN41001_c0_g2_i1.p2  ORF type:complete len:102 (-),score=8.07 TRINITY_DN41001_c0_g2_i1:586-891(-)